MTTPPPKLLPPSARVLAHLIERGSADWIQIADAIDEGLET